MDNHFFRTAINGFNRQDVMEYIERIQTELEELRRVSEENTTALDRYAQEKEDATGRLVETSQALEEARQNLDNQNQELTDLRQKLVDREEALCTMEAERERLAQRVKELEANEEGLRRDKERLAQLELDARQRGDAVVAEAEALARSVLDDAGVQANATETQATTRAAETVARARVQSEALLRDAEERIFSVVEQHQALLRSFTAISCHVTNELRKLDSAVSQLPDNFNSLQGELNSLLEKAKQVQPGNEES